MSLAEYYNDSSFLGESRTWPVSYFSRGCFLAPFRLLFFSSWSFCRLLLRRLGSCRTSRLQGGRDVAFLRDLAVSFSFVLLAVSRVCCGVEEQTTSGSLDGGFVRSTRLRGSVSHGSPERSEPVRGAHKEDETVEEVRNNDARGNLIGEGSRASSFFL